MKILITGGAGYIGTELIKSLDLLDYVHEIVVYDNLSRGNFNLFIGVNKLSSKVSFIHGDILDTRKLKKALDQVDTVFHLAAKVTTPFDERFAHEFEQVNHWGTAELSYLIEQSNVQRCIYLSSASVYGASDDMSNVTSNPTPTTAYGISKLKGEEYVSRLKESGKQVDIIRVANVYGYSKSMRFDSVINKFMFDAHYKSKIQIYGNGAQYRPFIQINRLVEGLITVLDQKNDTEVTNRVEANYSLMDIAEQLQVIYPDLELIFTNQNVPMRNLLVQPNVEQQNATDSLLSDLKAFKSHFTFAHPE